MQIKIGATYKSISTGFRARVTGFGSKLVAPESVVRLVSYELLHSGVECEVSERDFCSHYRPER